MTQERQMAESFRKRGAVEHGSGIRAASSGSSAKGLPTPSIPESIARDFQAKPLDAANGRGFYPTRLWFQYDDILSERNRYEKELLRIKLNAVKEYNDLTEKNDNLINCLNDTKKKLDDCEVSLNTCKSQFDKLVYVYDGANERIKKLEKKIMNWRYIIQDLSDEYDFWGNEEYKKMISDMETEARKKKVVDDG